jgi:hypothetical protein
MGWNQRKIDRYERQLHEMTLGQLHAEDEFWRGQDPDRPGIGGVADETDLICCARVHREFFLRGFSLVDEAPFFDGPRAPKSCAVTMVGTGG